MFKNFGYRDIFVGIRKYRFVLLLVGILSILLGVFMGVSKVQSFDILNNKHPSQYIATTTFYVNPNSEFPTQKEAKNYSAILSSDYCSSLVYSDLVGRFGEDGLKTRLEYDMTGLDIQVVDVNLLSELVVIETVSDTYVVNITVTTHDKEVSCTIIDSYNKYALGTFAKQIQPMSVIHVGQADKEIEQDPLMTGGELRPLLIGIAKNIIKYSVVSFVACMAVTLVILIAIMMLAPTLNRKSDFMGYDLPVLGELTTDRSKAASKQ